MIISSSEGGIEDGSNFEGGSDEDHEEEVRYCVVCCFYSLMQIICRSLFTFVMFLVFEPIVLHAYVAQ